MSMSSRRAFLGGLAAGAVAAALIPGPSANPAGGDRDDWRMSP